VIGASVGALIGLAFIKTSPWLILVGAVAGALIVGMIGLRVGLSRTPLAQTFDETALNVGCCLMELVGYGCIGCGTVAATLIGAVLLVGLHRFGARPLSATLPVAARTARVGAGYSRFAARD
jgi:hypothetical protein